ncbi:MAG: peptidylprolyl isomerase [Actinobacteria bacterium]|nr:peptidylprolyl isomerase [Actinomycetota bacterium]
MAPSLPPFRAHARLLAVVLAGVLALAACSGGGGAAGSPAARVNGTAITDADVTGSVPLYRFVAGLSQSPCGVPEAGETEEQACARFTLSNLVRERLVLDYAAANDLTVTEAEVDDAFEPLLQSMGGQAALEDRLAEDGLTLAQFRDFATRLLLLGEVREDLAASEVSDAELRESYEQRELEFATIHAEHILLDTREEALDVVRLATPENFQELARERSTDPSVAQNGGDLGEQPASRFVPEFSEAALALEPGEIGQPIESQFGWHVIHLIDKQVVPFEDAREELLGEVGSRAFGDWLDREIREGEIEVNPRYGRLDPETGEVLPITSTSPTSGEAGEAP